MDHHLTLFLYIILFIHSTIGYGFIFSRIANKEMLSINIGYIGIIGFFLIIFPHCLLPLLKVQYI